MTFDIQSILQALQQKTIQRALLAGLAAIAFIAILLSLLTSEESRYDYVYNLIEEHYTDFEADEDTPEDFDPLDAIRSEIQPDDLPVLVELTNDSEPKTVEATLLLIAGFNQAALTPLFSVHQAILKRNDANLTATFHKALLIAAKDDMAPLNTLVQEKIQQADNYLITSYKRCQSLPQDAPEMVFSIESMAQAMLMTEGLPVPVQPDILKKALAQLKEEMLPAKLKIYEDKESSKLDAFLGKAPKNLVIVPQKIEDKCNSIINDPSYSQWVDLLHIAKSDLNDQIFITHYCNTTQTHTLHRDSAYLLIKNICRLPKALPQETKENTSKKDKNKP